MHCSPVPNRRLSSILLSFFLLVFLLIPSDPLQSADENRPDQIDEAEAESIHEAFSIYSILHSHRMDLSEDAIWELAKTILEESKKFSLEPMLVVAVIKVESGFQHKVISRAGARGLMQILPSIGHGLAEQIKLENWRGQKSLDDPVTNVKLGIFYVAYLKERFKNLKVALVAYNRGPTDVSSKLAGNEVLPSGYARRVLSAYHRFRTDRPRPPSFLPAVQIRSGTKL